MDGYQPGSDDSKAEQVDKYAMKSKLEQIFAAFDKESRGRIATKYLLSMIEEYERNQSESLLNDDTRPTFQNFSGPTASSESSSRRIKFRSLRPNWRNRPNAPVGNRDGSMAFHQEPDYGEDSFTASKPPNRTRRLSSSGLYESPAMMSPSFASPFDPQEEIVESFEGSGGIDEAVSSLITSNNNDDPAIQLSRLYRHTVDLTKRLKESERHLASVARQHEDRIEELQHKLDETKADLNAKKREIQKVAKNLTSQRQLYQQLKKSYEEQCDEAENLKILWNDDRDRLEDKLMKLEMAAQRLEAELSNENLHLKETIDKLRLELEEMERSSRVFTESEVVSDMENVNNNKENLQTEMINQVLASIEEGGSDSNTDDLRDRQLIKTQRRRNDTLDINASEEQSHSRSGELDRYRGTDIDHNNRKQGGSRSRRQVTDINGITRNTSGRDVESQYQILSSELGVQYALIEGILRNRDIPSPHDKRDRDRQIRNNNVDGDSTDLVRHPKLSRQSPRKSKRRAPVPEIEPQSSEKIEPNMQSSKALVPRNQNMTVGQHNVVVNSTVTFALYTLVIYLFGIITSVFVLDTNQGTITYSDWLPHDVVDDGWTMRSFQIILYWIETLLNDGNMRVPT
ncbi:2777_t:CDS:10 [Funneliformis geosporum]|uniref:2777_t:CDS:1 n=1 Tax=Funneliformis geosporum TaxID=1117311 RepID=A0A9W4WY27_9GLOM|nr:2777_t:CDS:10 [Funneliformis geosporum]